MINLLGLLKFIGLYFIVLFSFFAMVRGILEFKVFMSFEDKSSEDLNRIIVKISFGISNLTFILYQTFIY